MKKTKKQLISGLTVLGLLTTTILSPVQTGRAQAAAKIKVNKTNNRIHRKNRYGKSQKHQKQQIKSENL